MVKEGREFLGRNIIQSKVPGAHFVPGRTAQPCIHSSPPRLLFSLFTENTHGAQG